MKNKFIKIVLPSLLIIIAVVSIGSGCSSPDDFTYSWYPDDDGDTFGRLSETDRIIATNQPAGYVRDKTDCDDTDADVHPDAVEIPDNTIDENCNGKLGYTFYVDKDNDGFGRPGDPVVIEIEDGDDAPANFSFYAGDCDDNNDAINPKAREIWNNDIDDNCNGEVDIDDILYIDADGDGYGSQLQSAADGVSNNLDCNDADGEVHPYTREYLNDGVDSNCDGNDNT